MNQDLTKAVMAAPEEDAPRPAYAVACENTDPERAEFIRLQVAHAVACRARDDEEARRLFARLFDLPDGYADRWAGSIRDHARHFRFYRGFVEYVEMDAQTFLDRADALYAMAPIRRLKLTDIAAVLDDVCRSPHLAQIVSLTLDHGPIGDRAAQVLARSPHIQKLVRFQANGLTDVGVEALAASPNLPSLRQVLGLPEGYNEIVWSDQGQTINVLPPPAAPAIEEKYGYQRWLHPMQETNWRGIDDAAL